MAQIFLEVEPLTGRCHVEAAERRTRRDWARWIEGMPERRYLEAERVVPVLDRRNTHGIESLYATFEPRHARWLNIAEIELSTLCGQCLDRRVPSLARMQREIGAWVGSESTANRDQLAIQDGGCPDQAEEPLSATSSVIGY